MMEETKDLVKVILRELGISHREKLPNGPALLYSRCRKAGGWPSRGQAQSSFSARCRETQPVRKHFPLPLCTCPRTRKAITHNMDSCFLFRYVFLVPEPGLIKRNPRGKHTKSVLRGPVASYSVMGNDFRPGIEERFLIIKTALQER